MRKNLERLVGGLEEKGANFGSGGAVRQGLHWEVRVTGVEQIEETRGVMGKLSLRLELETQKEGNKELVSFLLPE